MKLTPILKNYCRYRMLSTRAITKDIEENVRARIFQLREGLYYIDTIIILSSNFKLKCDSSKALDHSSNSMAHGIELKELNLLLF